MCRASQINPVIVGNGEEGVGIQAAVSTLMVEVMVVVDSSRTVTVTVFMVKGTATVTISKNQTVESGFCEVKVCVASLAA